MNRPFRNPVKEALRERRPTIGSWVTMGHPSIAEILGRAGFTWLVADLEHSVIGLSEMQGLFQAAETAGATPLARVGENRPGLLSRVMDAGAYGVIVPMVNTREEAARAVAAVKYPPQGRRGVGLSRAQGYGLDFENYAATVNEESLVIVQIEHKDAVENVEEILSTEGVDGFLIGPYDLSASLGVPGQFDHPDVRRALDRVRDAAKALDVPAGFHAVEPAPDQALARIREGYLLVAYSVDILFLARSASRGLQEIREGIAN